ncbi:HAD-superfamily hydrolase, subfamily IA, variant 1 [Shewanella halifaxensis HAW-EB4]|uniref:HAD-superfamily hydrolase, subfamily IA, variant 1 n=1 Tax=Shewanella halifaxensis (strain HAW-EB4) TaxID=458817 RepID=B0TT37_SHEHH|nr:HAD-IA family hydrolase [Shewanella halifaxensis]ABZ76598.1 HAD-superfamily hydrolase, subfamily IA, variant 1 [Shewanella halifaxensis HAW-EB4]
MTNAHFTLIKGVLFDLDGTLADTAPDMVEALNMTLQAHGHERVPLAKLRASASHGSIAMIRTALPAIDEESVPVLQQSLFDHYQQINGDNCDLFDGLDRLLDTLTLLSIPYGVVTNKPARFTRPLLNKLGLTAKMPAVVSGDSTLYSKPHTAPMLLAAQQLKVLPENILYLGDAERDLVAAKSANMISGLAAWGYIGPDDNPSNWPADFSFESGHSLADFFNKKI